MFGFTVLLATVTTGLATLLVCLAVSLTVMLGHSYTLGTEIIFNPAGWMQILLVRYPHSYRSWLHGTDHTYPQ